MKFIATFYSHFGAIRLKRSPSVGDFYRIDARAAKPELVLRHLCPL